MRFAIRPILLLFVISLPSTLNANSFEEILKKAALENGVLPVDGLYHNPDATLVEVGKTFFESERLSLNGNISCKTCHLAEFGSADGIPNAVGVGGIGHGNKRLSGNGKIVPRNTLPLWGRGGLGFSTFFWDGKVDFSKGQRISQFGNKTPSADPLIVTVHLPVVEIREMLFEDSTVAEVKKETTESANEIYRRVEDTLRTHERDAVRRLAEILKKEISQIQFLDIARSIAAFIRAEFRIKSTKFHNFIFRGGDLSEDEVQGGLIFYGKGKCSTCHSGPYFADFEFHAIPLPQFGFGKNGFGVDYGRFNVTLKPNDLYKFRTPPLLNVTRTPPYGHSGSAINLDEVIIYHFDPLRLLRIEDMDHLARHEYYKRLAISSQDILHIGYLTEKEVSSLVKFLDTLSFN